MERRSAPSGCSQQKALTGEQLQNKPPRHHHYCRFVPFLQLNSYRRLDISAAKEWLLLVTLAFIFLSLILFLFLGKALVPHTQLLSSPVAAKQQRFNLLRAQSYFQSEHLLKRQRKLLVSVSLLHISLTAQPETPVSSPKVNIKRFLVFTSINFNVFIVIGYKITTFFKGILTLTMPGMWYLQGGVIAELACCVSYRIYFLLPLSVCLTTFVSQWESDRNRVSVAAWVCVYLHVWLCLSPRTRSNGLVWAMFSAFICSGDADSSPDSDTTLWVWEHKLC